MSSSAESTPRRAAAIQFAIYFGVLLSIIALATFGGTNIVFGFLRDVPASDKIGHFMLFGALAPLADRALGYRVFRRVPLGPLAVVLFAIGDEMSQLFVAGRTFDLLDLAADFAGIAVFTALGRLVFRARTSSRQTEERPATRSQDS